MATNKKGKTSKSGKSKKVVVDYTKRIKEKPEYIFIEQTVENIGKITTVEKDGEIINYYESKPVESVISKFGKRYYKVLNKVEQEISSI